MICACEYGKFSGICQFYLVCFPVWLDLCFNQYSNENNHCSFCQNSVKYKLRIEANVDIEGSVERIRKSANFRTCEFIYVADEFDSLKFNLHNTSVI